MVFVKIKSLHTLQHSRNVVVLQEYLCFEDEDIDLVLEFFPMNLELVIRFAKKELDNGGLSVGETKRWNVKILLAVNSCPRSLFIYHNLKPTNLLVLRERVLKLDDFGLLNCFDNFCFYDAS